MYISFVLALFLAIVAAFDRSTPPAGALVVSKSATNGSGQFTTVQAAVDSLSVTATGQQSIFIMSGSYNEQVLIPSRKANLTIYGSTSDSMTYKSNTVTITANHSINEGLSDDGTGTLRVKANNFKLYNVNVVNSFGKGAQAIALSSYTNNSGFYGCQFSGYQDTVLGNTGNQFFARSLIQGATDFIFGQTSVLWFEGCDLRVSGAGYCTASGRNSATNPSWYIINRSNINVASGYTVAANTSSLGRPWGPYARVTYQFTVMSNVIPAAGFSHWTKGSTTDTANVDYSEFNNTGPGSVGPRDTFVYKRSAPLTLDGMFPGWRSWIDPAYIN